MATERIRRGVVKGTTRLDLPPEGSGDFIEIWTDLTEGQRSDIVDKSVRTIAVLDNGEQKTALDYSKYKFVTAATYITAWNLIGPDGAALVWPNNISLDKRIQILRELDRETIEAINDAIGAHEEARAKNAQSGATSGAPPSPSAA